MTDAHDRPRVTPVGVEGLDLAAGRHVGATWRRVTLGAALILTLLESLLLQRKRSFFTGGFLAAEHVSGPGEAAGFLVASLIVDASLAGLLAWLLLWATSRLRLTRAARGALVLGGALAPLLVANIIGYRLLAYLGDAFDLGLMFELTGRRPAEILAVASDHLGVPFVWAMGVSAAVGALVWVVNRLGRGHRAPVHVPSRIALHAVAVLAAGLVTTVAAGSANDTLEEGLRRKASGNALLRLGAWLTDFDRDGYGMVGRIRDPHPFDRNIYPYALDIPGNGIDENGVGGDLPSAEPRYHEGAGATLAWRHRPDMVLFVLESFRADAVGRTVNGVPVTPVLDALAREGVSSARAFSHNGYTAQSRFHLMTGSLVGLRGGTSLIDDFSANGYQTAYFSGQDESFGGAAFGIGFERAEVRYDARQDPGERYTRFTTAGSLAVPHDVLEERIARFLEARTDARPLFLYVNFHDTHFPYHHGGLEPLTSHVTVRQSQIAPSRRDAVQEMYFNAAANVDRAVGRTLEIVTRALGRPPAVIVTADHGESLFDEGFLGHGYALNDVQTRIPLIVRGLSLVITEPFGQVELRDAIGVALACEDDAAVPVLIDVPGKTVFQYLGNLDRPRQIGFATGDARLIYDFRSRRFVRSGQTSHQLSAQGEHDDLADFHLVHAWERMMLAAAEAGPDPDPPVGQNVGRDAVRSGRRELSPACGADDERSM
jgi:hypothetical protein